ncbi:MAG: toll/interleukin-1 receptor domain-containing protein [Magnetococcus sp. YQC-5]
MMGRPVNLFVSYARKNRRGLERVLEHIQWMVHQGLVREWHDNRIDPGVLWEPEIEKEARQADAVLCLVSAAFLASEYIQTKEIPIFKQRKGEDPNFQIHFLLLADCLYDKDSFVHPRQFLHEKPIKETKNSQAFTQPMRKLLEKLMTHPARLESAPSTPLPQPVAVSGVSTTLEALLTKVPGQTTRLFGREQELNKLNTLAAAKGVLVWVGSGGVGKSALTRKWLADRVWPEGTRFLGVSFYSQGLKDQATGADGFLRSALAALGDPKPDAGGDYDKGQRLAALLAAKPSVLVLDGLEPLQHPPEGERGGRLKDLGIFALLATLLRHPGEAVCLVSTRLKIADMRLSGLVQEKIDILSEAAAVELLKFRDVWGTEALLQATANRCGCHALALTLMAEYLHTFEKGMASRFQEVSLINADSHAESVMRAYDMALEREGEVLDRELVRLMGLFDRPADGGAVLALRKVSIAGVTEALYKADVWQFQESLARLRQWGLVNSHQGGEEGTLDAHPLVREWFGEQLKKENPDGWRAAHRVLFEFFQRVPKKHQPDTLEELEPLYRAVRHGCLAGLYGDAWNLVFWPRICRGNERYAVNCLGAFSSDLAALAGFFLNGWEEGPTSEKLSKQDQKLIWDSVGRCLVALGRLVDATAPNRFQDVWMEKSINFSNIAHIQLLLGRIFEGGELAARVLENLNYYSNCPGRSSANKALTEKSKSWFKVPYGPEFINCSAS